MQTGQPLLRALLEATKQFFVPHFQRPYTWEARHWKNLWQDLVELHELNANLNVEAKPHLHFLGSIVCLVGTSVPEGIPKYVLIDGQQRLTTLMILLAAMRSWSQRKGTPRVAEEIQKKILINEFADGEDIYKLLPTEGADAGLTDREALKRIVDGEIPESQHRLVKAYEFFAARLNDSKLMPEAFKKTVLDRLILVSITLDDANDNPHAIFESLNHKGAPLRQSDLVRNYFFMRAPRSDHEVMYVKQWLPIETTVGKDRIEEFLRQYLMREGGQVKIPEVYTGFKVRLERKTTQELGVVLNDMRTAGSHYMKIVAGSASPSSAPVPSALNRLRRLDLGVATPFLMAVLRDRDASTIDDQDVFSIASFLENFAIRRFICSVPTHGLNKNFATLYKTAKEHPEGFVVGVRTQLVRRGYPSDADVRAHFPNMRLYRSGDGREKAKLILESLDRESKPKEAIQYDNLTIEHVMPQTLSAAWKASLPANWEDEFGSLVDSPGNLTLTGYNSELGNLAFAQKRLHYKSSPVCLNQYFASIPEWGFADIKKRSGVLLEGVLRVWPTLDIEGSNTKTGAFDPTGTKPRNVKLLGESVSVDSWRAVLKETLRVILEYDPELGERLQQEIPRYFTKSTDALRTPLQVTDGFFVESHLSARGVLHLCHQVLAVAEIELAELEIET